MLKNIKKTISIIIPCRNEEKFITNTLNSIYNKNIIYNLEVLIIDGRSDDNTRDIVQKFQKKYSEIKLIDNPEKTVPYAMNYGIQEAEGDIIIRLDAHSVYPKDYISTLIYWIKKLDADNVGGSWDTIPANSSLESQTIAYSTSHYFGIGNAEYRISKKSKPYKVDTVPFGCYKKEVFKKIGLFDTDLTRNQDDEFNARLIQNGGTIYLIPNLKIKYFARDKFSKMFIMFYQYGLFKPLVNMKLKQPATVRQFIPPLFVLFLISGTILSLLLYGFFHLFCIGLSIYFGISTLFSFKIANEKNNLKLVPYLIYSFFLIHLSYGLGYLKGIWNFILLNRHQKNNLTQVNISR